MKEKFSADSPWSCQAWIIHVLHMSSVVFITNERDKNNEAIFKFLPWTVITKTMVNMSCLSIFMRNNLCHTNEITNEPRKINGKFDGFEEVCVQLAICYPVSAAL